MVCDDCTKNRSVQVCGSCREITKYDLVQMVLGEYIFPKVILDETQRNRTGSRSCKKLSIDSLKYSIIWYHKNTNLSYREIAKELGVSVGTVSNVINGKR